MANYRIISARLEPSVYSGLKAILESKNLTISEYLKSTVENGVSLIQPNSIKKTDKGFLLILLFASFSVYAINQLVKINQINNRKN